MQSADRLREFVAIVDAGSISSAARALGLPRATLSRRIAATERALGVRLLHRATRELVLTTAGRELYHRACRVVADAEAAWASVQRLDDVPRGPLRVSVPDARVASAELFVDFALEFPEVRLQVTTTPRHVDLVSEGIDVAVRFGTVTDDSLIARRLWTSRSIAVASPGYLDARGTPLDLAALAEHDSVVGFAGESTPARAWPLLAGGTVPVEARLASNDVGVQLDAALRGVGIALLPQGLVRSQLQSGLLCSVLEETLGGPVPANLVFVDREFSPPQLRAFIERAVEYFRAWAPS